MKKYIIIFSILVVVSCNDGFLDKQPLETASISSLFASATDVELAVNGIYDVMQGDIWGGSFFYLPPHLDAISENATFCCS